MADSTEQKVCFVIMGFGKKTDYETGQTFDLDATYENIIEPAVTGCNLKCVRADKYLHSGMIDRPMFQMLLRADLVIADISTANVNAIYELGVRHAFKPNATIIMKENKGRRYFDLNRISTFEYEHLGTDIGAREARRATTALKSLIAAVMEAKEPDSPIYTVLPALREPQMSEAQFKELLASAEQMNDRLTHFIETGRTALKNSRPAEAAAAFAVASEFSPENVYLVQQLALATYKSEQPSKLESLDRAWTVISRLKPDQSNDPETLGLAGAIRKRRFEATRDRAELDAAIGYYGRGFDVSRDYYNGENLATLYDVRASRQDDPAEAQFDRMSARKTRTSIVAIIRALLASATFKERSDQRWVFATMANALFALGQADEGEDFERRFYAEQPSDLERQSYRDGKETMLLEIARSASAASADQSATKQ